MEIDANSQVACRRERKFHYFVLFRFILFINVVDYFLYIYLLLIDKSSIVSFINLLPNYIIIYSFLIKMHMERVNMRTEYFLNTRKFDRLFSG